MTVGSIIAAPCGWRTLAQSENYYLLANQPDLGRVVLVRFIDSEGRITSQVAIESAGSFEAALVGGSLTQAPCPKRPPWLERFAGIDLDHVVHDSKSSNLVSERERVVLVAMDKQDEWLRSPSPFRALNRLARECAVNESRYRCWVLSYYLFGRKKGLLLPLHFRSGRWDRQAVNPSGPKLGAPSLCGGGAGHRMTATMATKCVQGYEKHKGLGRSRRAIYREALKSSFGCKTQRVQGKMTCYHPKGEPFPTKYQFWYAVEKALGKKSIQITRFGAEHVRNRSGCVGTFVEGTSNLFQEVEADAYFTIEAPTGADGQPLPPLAVCRLRDRASGTFTGLGASVGAERLQAYRSAQFAQALPKERYCRLFGFSIEPDEWLGEGLSPKRIKDRGVGSCEGSGSPLEEMAPAYSGQSKAVIEASHPKNDSVSGGPTHLVSSLGAVQLFVAQIVDTIVRNQTMDVSDRLTPEMKAAGVSGTPNAIFRYLDGRGRNDAVTMDFDDAVRHFLVPVSLKCTSLGIEHYGNRYSSDDLRNSGLLDKAVRGDIPVDGYLLPLCVRHLWIEHGGKLLELELQLPLSDDPAQSYISLTDAARLHAAQTTQARVDRSEVDAITLHYQLRFEETYGVKFQLPVRRPGKSRARTANAKKSAKAARRVAEGA